MRTTLHDVFAPKHRYEGDWFGRRLGDWWIDLPYIRHPIANLRVLLLTPGAGWLRWGWQADERHYRYDDWLAPEPYSHAPPLRRYWQFIRWRDRSVLSCKADRWPHDWLVG